MIYHPSFGQLFKMLVLLAPVLSFAQGQVDLSSLLECVEPEYRITSKKGSIKFNSEEFIKMVEGEIDLDRSKWTKMGRNESYSLDCRKENCLDLKDLETGKYKFSLYHIEQGCFYAFEVYVPDCSKPQNLFRIAVSPIIDTGSELIPGSVSILPRSPCLDFEYLDDSGNAAGDEPWRNAEFREPKTYSYAILNRSCGLEQKIYFEVPVCEDLDYTVEDSYSICTGNLTQIKLKDPKDRSRIAPLTGVSMKRGKQLMKEKYGMWGTYKNLKPYDYDLTLTTRAGCSFRKKHTVTEYGASIEHEIKNTCRQNTDGAITLIFPKIIPEDDIRWSRIEKPKVEIARGRHIENVGSGKYAARILYNKEECTYQVKILGESTVEAESIMPDLGEGNGKIVLHLGMKRKKDITWSKGGTELPNINLSKLSAGSYTAKNSNGCVSQIEVPHVEDFDLIELFSPSLKGRLIKFPSFQKHIPWGFLLVNPISTKECPVKATRLLSDKAFTLDDGDCACFEIFLHPDHELSDRIKRSIHCFEIFEP